MISSQLMYCLADTVREGTDMVLKGRGREGGGGKEKDEGNKG